MTPEELIVTFLYNLNEALANKGTSTNDRLSFLFAATPAVTAYYLKGQ
jgi:hypothetical protein